MKAVFDSFGKIKKRILPVLCALLMMVSNGVTVVEQAFVLPVNASDIKNINTQTQENQVLLEIALVYSGEMTNEVDAYYNQLLNTLGASKRISLVQEPFGEQELSKYDIVYAHKSLTYTPFETTKQQLKNYVKLGGALFLTNEFCEYFDEDFLGIKSKTKLSKLPDNLTNFAKGTDLEDLAQLVLDFEKLYKLYEHYDDLKMLDYGYGFEVEEAEEIVGNKDNAVYVLNRVNEGYVFLTNPLLPNIFNNNSYNFKTDFEYKYPYSATTNGANTLIFSEFQSFVSKQKYGFSLRRTFGSFGTTPIAWQLHYEEITGIRNDASIVFSELCKKYNQVPSFTLIRNTYKWFARYETLSYLDIENNIAKLDLNEGAYSNGTHVVSGKGVLYVNEFEDTGSYFVDQQSAKQRAYPAFFDFDGDGKMDILSGSSDGKFYLFKTKSNNGRLVCDVKQTLTHKDGSPLSAGKYSAPCVYDFDYDGYYDIVSGSSDGKIYLFKNDKNGGFEKPEVLASTGLSQSMPVFGDVDRDGEDELVSGSVNGIVVSYEISENTLSDRKILIENKSETFLAPFVFDIDNDTHSDLLLGTYDGYVRRYIGTASGFVKRGYVMADERNYKGNYRVKFGNNAVPRVFDADGDNALELVCGNYEYGLNVPIDSEYFDAKEELSKQIKYIKDNNFYLGVHFYTNEFASKDREKQELQLHKNAFESYSVPFENLGVNQHTWYVNTLSDAGTFESVSEAGFLWDSGYQSPKSETAPQVSAENVLGIPTFADDNNSLMVLNTGTLLYLDDKISSLTAKYNLPMSIYYHCDFAYKDKTGAENDIKHVDNFVKEHGYSFVREDELVKMAAASYNTNFTVKKTADGFVINKQYISNDFALFDENYGDCVGVKLEVSQQKNIDDVFVDAKIYDKNKDCIIFTPLDTASITFGGEAEQQVHIVSINRPANVKYASGTVSLSFVDEGYSEIKLYGKAQSNTKGVTTRYDGKYTVFYGYNLKKVNITY